MSKVVFVTGISGFLASHIVQQLVEQGHCVIGTSRSKKLVALRELYKNYPSVEVIEAGDLATARLEEPLKRAEILIHTASPLPGHGDFETMLKTSTQGTLNILEQAKKAGIKKIVVTSSMTAALGDPRQEGTTIKNDYWNAITKDKATPASGTTTLPAYMYAKTHTEKALWEWARENPHVAVTTINPTFFYGPFPNLSLPAAPGDFGGLSTNLMMYNFLYTKGVYTPSPGYTDVREVAHAHLGAAFRQSSAGKRVLVTSPHPFAIQPLLDILKEKRPSVIRGRLNTQPVPQFKFGKFTIDYESLEEATGLKLSEFHTLEEVLWN
ncbi:hypothetical protein CPB83DRAFT_860532 [Crepidotus variabilis]|uniref:NAD-dependent epimerase/dehydratase domain-containing protein n=1 Tax=Crepidotus variabilis TaxID=179855 RepID=A0A9P6JLM1_9AGAR|nr:hypothetical protein CPB83DRAFT_860532 [Crepidotus variabilis]